MSETLENRLNKILNETYIKKILTEYFESKGFKKDDFKKDIYPPSIGDMLELIPQFNGKVEIMPYVEDLNPYTGQVIVEWNLFVLGNQRISLGNSSHKNTADIQQAVMGEKQSSKCERRTSPEQIIEFITNALSKSKYGNIDPEINPEGHGIVGSMQDREHMRPGSGGKFYGGSQGFEKNRAVF